MVYLSRIYTKTGDQGETGLGDGSRVPKNHVRVSAYGSVDELNAVLGLITSNFPTHEEISLLQAIQNDLFDVGADLCVPEQRGDNRSPPLRVTPEQTSHLEEAIDRLNARLLPLQSFVLPGGRPEAAWLHLARTVCRRAEREVVTLSQCEKINQEVVIYLNRLSDLLFVLARVANDNGKGDLLWRPGKSQTGES
jgi:cob(I)alamin adenosyltransferase